MNEQTILVDTPDGKMETFLAMPETEGPFPPIILYMDIWGMREQLRDIARYVASEGFACAAPSLYYREGNKQFNYRHDNGKTKSISILTEQDRQELLAYGEKLTDEMVVSDTFALITQLRTIDNIAKGFAGSFGYCMGGRHVIKVAAKHPYIFRATACFHGTFLVTPKSNSPHLGANLIQGEVYFGMGENDPFTPPDVIAAVRTAFDNSPAATVLTVHPNTEHGYAIPDRDVYSRPASEADWKAVLRMFKKLL